MRRKFKLINTGIERINYITLYIFINKLITFDTTYLNFSLVFKNLFADI